MIANARMYGVSPEVAALWRELLSLIIAAAGQGISAAGQGIELLEHAAPEPIEELWGRADMAAVFMCGLPFARTEPQPVPIAAPVPSPAAFGGEARYWSEFVVRRDSGFETVADSFGSRIAFTVPGSQSGYVAALSYFQALHLGRDPRGGHRPLFAEIIAPTITPAGALEAVVGGAAEIAPIDAYAFELLRAYRPDLTAAVRVVGHTAPTPIPLLVASPAVASGDAGGGEALAAAFLAAHADTALKPWMDRLLLERFVRPDPAAYRVLANRFTWATQFWRAHPLAAVTHPAFAW
jgi:ABC-type phosphate/phosphonate transport system substrate-binding protein